MGAISIDIPLGTSLETAYSTSLGLRRRGFNREVKVQPSVGRTKVSAINIRLHQLTERSLSSSMQNAKDARDETFRQEKNVLGTASAGRVCMDSQASGVVGRSECGI